MVDDQSRHTAARIARARGQVLYELAALQRSSAPHGISFRQAVFQGTKCVVSATGATFPSTTFEVSVPYEDAKGIVSPMHLRLPGLPPPLYDRGDDFPGDPGIPPTSIATAVMADLAENYPALWDYRADIPPLHLDRMTTDYEVAHSIDVEFRVTNEASHVFTLEFERHSMPLVGVTFAMVDHIAEQEIARRQS